MDGEIGNERVTDKLKRDEQVPNVGVADELNIEVVDEVGPKRLDDVDGKGFDVVVKVVKLVLLRDVGFRLSG